MKIFKALFLGVSLACIICLAFVTGCKKDTTKAIQVCDTLVCQNSGHCVNNSCSCPTGYEGTHCETQSNAKFVGVWDAVENSSNGNQFTYTTVITAGAPGAIVLQNFSGAGSQCYGNATVSGGQITFTNESVCSFQIYNGTGSISADGRVISVHYSDSINGISETITGTWTKQ